MAAPYTSKLKIIRIYLSRVQLGIGIALAYVEVFPGTISGINSFGTI